MTGLAGNDQNLLYSLPFHQFLTVTTEAVVATSEALIVYNTANGRLFYNENGAEAGLGSGGVFATLTTIPTIKAEDFLLIA